MKILPLAVCAAVTALAFCSCGNTDRGEGVNHMYDVPLLGNPQSLDPQYASDPASNTVIKNMYSGLMKTDRSGNVSCCNALSYKFSDDGLSCDFVLRNDNYWFIDENHNDIADEGEYFPVTADDYVFAFRRILDPKMQSPYAQDFSFIKGAGAIMSGTASPETAGVRAIDEYSLRIELEYPCAEFLNMLATTAASPCNKEFFESTKGRYGLDDKSVMSNGAFYMRQWFYDPYGVHNILYMRRSDINVREDYPVIPAYLSFTIQRTEDDIRSLFKDEDIDCFTTLSNSYSSKKYSVNASEAITLGIIFNKNDRYFSNQNMRRAIALSIDREELSGSIGSDADVAYGIIPPAVCVAGRSYRELSPETQFGMLNKKAAVEAFTQAKTELNIGSADGVKILVCADTVNSGYIHQLSQSIQENLGIYIGIEDVTAEDFESRIASGDYSLALYPVYGSSPSASSYIGEFAENECLHDSVVNVPDKISMLKSSDLSELVENYSAAERSIISGYGFIPLFYKNIYVVAGKDNEDIYCEPGSCAVDFRFAKNYS